MILEKLVSSMKKAAEKKKFHELKNYFFENYKRDKLPGEDSVK